MFLLPCIGAITQKPGTAPNRAAWILVALISCVFIGFRHEVGADWHQYLSNLHRVAHLTFFQSLEFRDPGYYAINWVVARLGGEVHWVNLFCAVIVVFGLNSFAKSQPLPWVCIMVAVPYLILVVAMGYTRQGAAIGFALAGLAALGRHETNRFVVWVLLGFLFHKSAILLLPMAAMAATQNRTWTFLWVGVTSLFAAYAFIFESSGYYLDTYINSTDYRSQGALIRVAMNSVPSLVILFYRNRLFYSHVERKLWVWMAIFSLLTIPLVSVSSTAVDRVALYFIPIQLMAFSRLPFLVKTQSQQQMVIFGIAVYYGAVQFVWLNFAGHAFAWLPYKNFIFI